MKYFIGMIIVIFSFIFSDLILRALMSYWYVIFPVLAAIYFFVVTSVPKPYEFPGSQKVLSVSKWIIQLTWIVLITFFVLILLRVVFGGLAENNPRPIYKKLHITIKENNPCFYVDSFEGVQAFDVYKIQVDKLPMPYEGYWCIGLCENTTINIPLFSFVGENQCIPYGVKNEVFSTSAKKLEMDVLYEASISGIKRNIPSEKVEDGDEISIDANFYLSKNPKTGEIKAIKLSGSQVDDWIKKMNEHNKSIEIIKEKK